MNVESEVKKTLKEFNLELKDNGIKKIVQTIKLLYGNNPTKNQIKYIINNSEISLFKR